MPYPSIQQIVICPISTLSVMYFVYGIYVLLFGTYIYMMRTSHDQTGERRNKSLYLFLTVALFVLSTILVVNETYYYVHGAIVGFDVIKDEDHDLGERYQNQEDLGESVS
ncbi:hypothetical protein VNI00_003475 [Paramarasmius palmivorus]|uniref:Uncharacterized protein n=1 Tax=Paramarasmius palmivorus TaxID=297713 RepID=A0AAW0DU22_9AGAR